MEGSKAMRNENLTSTQPLQILEATLDLAISPIINVVSLQSATDQLQEPHTSPGTTF
jgi:hypothetical protein